MRKQDYEFVLALWDLYKMARRFLSRRATIGELRKAVRKVERTARNGFLVETTA